MTDYEMLSIILMILSIVVSILIVYINQSKSNRPSPRFAVTLLRPIIWD